MMAAKLRRKMNFIHADFLLSTEASRRLFHEYASPQPIIDFHNHLDAAEIVADRKYDNLWQLWLEHDHYKWRLMRAAGIDENLITGTANPKDKFLAFASVVPKAIRNPVFDWTHLELKRFFDVENFG